jgi:predicted amidohydrolase
MIIALAQMKMAQDVEMNYQKTLRLIKEAAVGNAALIVFPEIQLTPFFPQYSDQDVSEFVIRQDDQRITGICNACRENHIFAVPNLYVEEDGKRYDMSLLIDDEGSIMGKQKMVHIAQCRQFYEQSYYTPSEEGFHVFETRLGKIGIVVCFDRHYPESIRTEALRGAELILIPTANTMDEPSDVFQWEVRVQAFQNSVNIAMCNRVGVEDNMFFSGESVVSDYDGNTLVLASKNEELLFSDIDLAAATKRRQEKPYTALRRKDLYE